MICRGCTLYTSCEPCPMCISAIIWSNISTVYYGCTKEDAEKIGFRDNYIYEYLNKRSDNVVKLVQINRDECLKLFDKYKKENKLIY